MTAADIFQAIDSLHVETNPAYKAGRLVEGSTWCNLFLHDVTKALGCTIPFMRANQQVDWLASIEGAGNGWVEVPEADAFEAARDGRPAVAVWHNPEPLGHGHVAILRPSAVGIKIAQAGAYNYSSCNLATGFGHLVPRFFTNSELKCQTQ